MKYQNPVFNYPSNNEQYATITASDASLKTR